MLNSSTINISTEIFNSHEEDHVYITIRRLQTVLIPVICGIGIIGNSLAAGAFFSSALRTTSCCLYLGVKCFSDIGFLLSLLIVWLYRVHIPIFNSNGLCQITVFLSYICAFLSVWFVVIITFENFIRISQPQWVSVICTPRMAKIVITVCIILSLCLYNFPVWTIGIVDVGQGVRVCSTHEHFQSITMILTYIDTLLTLVLPFVLMLILVPLITISAIHVYERKKRLFKNLIRRLQKGPSPETQVTKLLFAVSVVFLVLHTPSHGIRIKMMIMEFLQHTPTSYMDIILQRLFELFYYLDFCLSLAVYLFFGDNFKKVFYNMYFKRCSKRCEPGDNKDNHLCGKSGKRGEDV